MDPVSLMTIGAALGLGKSMLFDATQQRKQMLLAAKTAELSPWTGMHPQIPGPVDYLGPAMQGGFAGYALGQQEEETAAKQLEADRLQKYNNEMLNLRRFELGIPQDMPKTLEPTVDLTMSQGMPKAEASPSMGAVLDPELEARARLAKSNQYSPSRRAVGGAAGTLSESPWLRANERYQYPKYMSWGNPTMYR
jgi:hypothetical protein